MKKTSVTFLHRLLFLIPLKFLIGSLIFFLKDRLIGGAILFAGIIAVIYSVFLAYEIRKKQIIKVLNISSYFHISIGTLMLFFSWLIFFLEGKTKYVAIIFKLILGSIFIGIGFYSLYRKK